MKTGTGLVVRALLVDLENAATDTYLKTTATERYPSVRERAFREGVNAAIGNLQTLHIIEITETDDPNQMSIDEAMKKIDATLGRKRAGDLSEIPEAGANRNTF